MVKLDSIERKLDSQLIKYFKSEGYSNKDIRELGLYTIKFESNSQDNFIDVYIYAEISVDDFLSISDSLNDIVTSTDPSSYFDVISPGIYMARMYVDDNDIKNKIISEYELDPNDLTKFGESISVLLEDEFDEEFWVEDIYYQKSSKLIYAEFYSQSYETQGSIKIHLQDISDYQDLVDMYQDKFLESLIKNIVEI